MASSTDRSGSAVKASLQGRVLLLLQVERRLELVDIGLHIVIIAVFWATSTAAASNKAR